MKFFRSLGLAALLIALAALSPTAASGTELVTSSGMVTTGSTISAEAEGTTVFHGTADVECTGSAISAKTSNTGGASETVKANVESLTFTSCNATVTVTAKGTLEIHTQGGSGNGTLTSSGAQITTQISTIFGTIHCVYSTSSTHIGVITGSASTGTTAMIDTDSAVIPRTGGTGGGLCGSSAEWTGSYKVTSPDSLNVDPPPPASTTLTTSLSGEAKSGEEITVFEGAKVKDQATLSGTNAASATGTIKYFVYSDDKCEKLVTKAGESSFSEGKVSASEEKTLEAGAVYYWQAEYSGDSKNAASKSVCGKEVLTVKALVSTSLVLLGTDGEEEVVEGEKIKVPAGTAVYGRATLSGTNASKATGSVEYFVYSDSKCETLVAEAGKVTVAGTTVPASEEEVLEEGVFYWRAVYSGDALHKESSSSCGSAIAEARAGTSLVTTLSGGGKEGAEIEVTEGTSVTDSAKLSGDNAAEATGSVEYFVYSDPYCKTLVTKAGKVTVSGKTVPASTPQTLGAGVYFWQAEYSGDGSNNASKSVCGLEILVVTPPITTKLTGGELSGEAIEVPEGTPVSDSATLHTAKAAEATGSVEYFVYSDDECEEEVAKAGKVTVAGANVPSSNELELEQGTYYWVAKYSGDANNPPATSACGAEISVIVTPTSLNTTLSGGEEEGATIEVEGGTPITDSAELTGPNAAAANGAVSYIVYEDNECSEMVLHAGGGPVEEGNVPPSEEVVLPPGTYYWQASYTGDGVNQDSIDACGSEIEVVTGIRNILSSGEQSDALIEVPEGAGVTDGATLHGPNAAAATGYVEYFVYSDNQCEEQVKTAGKVTVTGASVPPSSEVELESPGVYYWQAVYSGDENNPPATSACGETLQVVHAVAPLWAGLGDSFSSGEGIEADGGKFYVRTKSPHSNLCHRSSEAWPGLVAEKKFGANAVKENSVMHEEPTQFIFRACSGAETKNLWSGGPNAATEGQWDEWSTGIQPKWSPTPAQNLWLTQPGGAAGGKNNPNISRVMLTIGGNDAGFGPILRACHQLIHEVNYTPDPCLKVITEREAEFGVIKTKIKTVLEDIAKKAPNAHIAVPVYPSMLVRTKGRIPVRTPIVVVDDVTRGDPKYGGGGWTAVGGLLNFTQNLNKTIVEAAKEAKAKGVKVEAIQTTYDAFAGHRFGDGGVRWVNAIVLSNLGKNVVESYHPTRAGHKALAEKVWAKL